MSSPSIGADDRSHLLAVSGASDALAAASVSAALLDRPSVPIGAVETRRLVGPLEAGAPTAVPMGMEIGWATTMDMVEQRCE